MTRTEFYGKFKGVNGPVCRGARMPEFNKAAVNEGAFPDPLRYKENEFDFKQGSGDGGDHLDITWVSQEWDKTDELIAEITRCLKYVGFYGTVFLQIRMRGESWDSDFAESHNLTIQKGEANVQG